MRFAAFFSDRSTLSKLVLVVAASASSGGLIAYADAKSDLAHDSSKIVTKKKVVVLGTGWAGTSFLRNLDNSMYDVEVISPRNYFAFTPLLPSVTCGTVEARSIIEPIRKLIKKKGANIKFWEAEGIKIDPVSKKVHCRSNTGTNMDGNGEFLVDYDYLIIATGAQTNTFNTPGVEEHCHFLKEVEDALKIRESVMDCFERASLPHLTDEERSKDLHFVIIGAGPTGVEFAAELHDFFSEDLVKLYPTIIELVKISVIGSAEHILTMFDEKITKFAEEKFQRDGIELKTGFRAVKVSDQAITIRCKVSSEETSVPYGMAVWSTGVGTRPVILDFMKQIGQGNQRVLATDEWLRVHGCDSVYAVGDCATISQRKVMEDILEIFKVADKDNSGTLTVKEMQEVLEDICIRYPQVELYLKNHHMRDMVDLLEESMGDAKKESIELGVEEFKKALCHVDSLVKSLPATAQVAAQQGNYLANCFNKMDCDKQNSEGPLGIGELRSHRCLPFRYKHLGQFAPLGGEQTAAELPGEWISIGHSTQWLWYSVYASKQVSWRTRALVVTDWMKRFIFGRDSSRI